MTKAKERNVTMHLPVDFVVGNEFKENTPHSVVDAKSGIPEGKMVNLIMKIKNYIISISNRGSILDLRAPKGSLK